MNRKTKIVATMGPATDQPGVLERLIAAGVDVFRINFSHGKTAEHAERIVQAREIAGRLGRDVGILCDLQGPKIRIENFADGAVELVEGRPFTLDTALGTAAGDVTMVGCAYQQLPQDVAAGDVLLLNDGAIALRVDTVDGSRVHCVVTQGGTLSGRKGINKLGGGLSAPALTDEDLANIRHAAEWNADFLAVSFPRTAADITRARELLQAAGGDAWIVAKIERAEALENLEDILRAADVAMVARTSTLTLLVALFLLMAFALPIGEFEGLPPAWFENVYNGLFAGTVLMVGLSAATVVMIYTTLMRVLTKITPGEDV